MIRCRGTAEKSKEETGSFARRKGGSSGKTSDGPVDKFGVGLQWAKSEEFRMFHLRKKSYEKKVFQEFLSV